MTFPRRTVLSAVLGGLAAGSVAYAAFVSALAHWPSVVRARGHGGAARPALVAVFVVVVVAGAVLTRGGDGLPGPVRVAMWLVGAGTAWVAWGLLDQHLLGTFDLAPGSAWEGAWDALFHGIGAVAAGVGVSMVGPQRVPLRCDEGGPPHAP